MPTELNQAALRARDEFHHLLASATREAEWQRFFTHNPFVLSMSLPFRLEPADILPLGRPGRTEPDFLFYPQKAVALPQYGIIELKKPSSRIITEVRANATILSRDAETAVQQASAYAKEFALHAPEHLKHSPLFLGNAAHVFVIMGVSSELTAKLGSDLRGEALMRQLPPNLRILPYDVVLNAFESLIPPPLYFLVPDPGAVDRDAEQLKGEIVRLWTIVSSAAAEMTPETRAHLARSAYGFHPDWLLKYWLPKKYSDIETLRTRISRGLDDTRHQELRELLSALRAAEQQAREQVPAQGTIMVHYNHAAPWRSAYHAREDMDIAEMVGLELAQCSATEAIALKRLPGQLATELSAAGRDTSREAVAELEVVAASAIGKFFESLVKQD